MKLYLSSAKSSIKPNSNGINGKNVIQLKTYPSCLSSPEDISTTKCPSMECSSTPPNAVEVMDLRVSYGPKINRSIVLNDVNATINTGCIYGLLGPSGCGKTTLLKCIMGCREPDLGSIKVFGHPSGSPGSGMPGVGVGYMPQDVALHDDLTIEEMLIYFGTLYLMPFNVIAKQIKYLTKFFELPDIRQLIGTLSGGQRRRVSFLATIIHKPRLLILDEPTVGVDPALREKIWHYLLDLTRNEKITVIITTHYIEECRRGHKIGFMNRGKIMVEDSPRSLMDTYHASTLEDVLYRICVRKSASAKKNNCNGGVVNDINKKCYRDDGQVIGEEEEDHSHPSTSRDSTIKTCLTREQPSTSTSSSSSLSSSNSSPSSSASSSSSSFRYLSDPMPTYSRKLIEESPPSKSSPISTTSQLLSNGIETKNRQLLSSSYRNNSIEIGEKNSQSNGQINGVIKNCHHTNRLGQYSRTDVTSWDVWRKRFRALMWRQWIQHKRRPEPLMGRIIVPLLVVVTYVACIGGTPKDLGLAVINRENCTTMDPCLSRNLIDSFNSFVFKKIPYTDMASAIRDVKTRKLWGLMEIHSNFTKAILLKNKYAEKAFDKVANHSIVKIRGDFSSKILMITMEVTINDIYQEFIYDGLRSSNLNPAIGSLPIRLTKSIFGEKQKVDYLGVRGFGGPGLIVIITYSVSCALMVLAIITDKNDGMFERNYAAGVSIGQIIASHVTTQFVFSSFTSTAIIWICVYILEIPCKGSIWEAWLLVLLQTLSGAGTGLCVASLLGSLGSCAMVCNAILLGSFTLSGVLWTNQCLPYYAKWATLYLPATFPAEALRTIMTRGLPASSPNAINGFYISIFWIIVLHAGSYKILKFFNR
ncbi:ABC transporter G family member 23-like [Brevipalpus obovatus]|uniref:ABC transporter G family member 23-like n=1 Tax=Brevipalpus obovatus TaxID=246614 RepID=UPI003D9F02B9